MKLKAAFIVFLLIAVHLAADPLIVAHRGASDYAPENTIPAFKLAWEHGADAIEGDFYLTKDGKIVCIHDENTKRVSGINKNVKTSTSEELRNLDVGAWFDEKFKGTTIPTLSEVISIVPKGKKIYIEIKSGAEILPELFEELQRSKLEPDQIVVISFDEEVIRELKKLDSKVMAYWLVYFQKDKSTGDMKPSLSQVLETLKTIHANGVSSGYNLVDENIIREIENENFEYHVWTVDHLETARKFKRWGAKSITTNLPYHMKKYMDKPMPPQDLDPDEPAYLPYSLMCERNRLIDAKVRRGPHYSDRMKLFMGSDYEKDGIVFIGDTLIEQFPISEFFNRKNVINCGVKEDRIQGITERLDVCIKAAMPNKVYLMAGMNDLLKDNPESIEKLGNHYEKLIRDLNNAAPEAEITVFSVLPMGETYADKNPLVHKLNHIIKLIVKDQGLEYFDLHPYFADENNRLFSHLTTQGFDLNPDGYLVWLKAILAEQEFREAVINYSKSWLSKYGGSFPVAKIDPPSSGTYPGNRGPNELVIYTPSYEMPSTNTNKWGTEAVLKNGVVEKQTLHNSPIPTDGFVVSGHGKAADWIEQYLKPGTLVDYDQNIITTRDIPESEMTPEQRLIFLKKSLFRKFNSIKKSGADETTKHNAFVILEKIQRIQVEEKSIRKNDLDEISRELKERKKKIGNSAPVKN